ncbi:hypothetical protein [Streptomyces sp. Tu 3180]|uniref:hypothetical protein n=1 Tax=Streptomyces sp. Tu 3180 TaxID=2682611 RepID=UPI001357AF40|nr:hypothetical protein [Streptomyces sp. Tu 3180]KAF3466715.1 hypothetical protein GL259_21955 [Streptomyces sp. Tu 3180]
MGSLRNPVGPLPSSIYWRRRVVLLSVLAVLALLITWVVTAGGGGGDDRGSGANGKNPAPSITPGPSGSGPAISQAPGGRDESGSGGSGGSSSGSGDEGEGEGGDDGANGDPAGSGGAGGSDGGAGGGAGGGSEGGTSSGVGAGDALPAGSGSGLPNCTANTVRLTLRSVRNAYEPGRTPTFLLTARNASGSDCKVDLGPESTVLTITQASEDDPYWASDDCPEGVRSLVFRVPAGESITYTVKWDRKPSAPRCATPPAGSAGAGTYLVEAKAPGFAKMRTSFVLEKD